MCLSQLARRAKRRDRQPLAEHAPPQSQNDPGLLAEADERTERLWRAVLELPMIHREVIVMNHLQQMSYKQIAGALGVPVGTVMSRLHNAREALREKLAGDRP